MAGVVFAVLAKRVSINEEIREVLWGGALATIPVTLVANVLVLVFAWVLTTLVAWVIVILSGAVVVYHVVSYLKDPEYAGSFADTGSAGAAIGSAVAGTTVAVAIGLNLVGSPVPSPRCAAIDSVKAALTSGLVPILSNNDLDCLRQAFVDDALPHVIADTSGAHGPRHSQSHNLTNLQVYHHEDSTLLIPGPRAEIRPVDRSRLQSRRTLSDPRWVHWTEIDSLNLGAPGLNIPSGVSYALLIKIDSSENTERLIEALREHKEAKIDSVWSLWHDAVAHEHLDEITPLTREVSTDDPSVNFKYARGQFIKLYVPAQGNDYRFNLIKYYQLGTNTRDQGLWLEHSHTAPCETCEIHGWCTDE